MENTPAGRGSRAIVVGVDGSQQSIAALQLAARLVPIAGDVIRAVAVWHYPVGFGSFTPLDWNPDQLAETALDQALAKAFPGEPPCAVERRVLQGPAAQVLVDESRHASMVVVGSRGHGGFVGLLLGSVSSAVAERAFCPVVIARGEMQLPEAEADPQAVGAQG